MSMIRPLRDLTVLGVVVGPLDVIDARADGDRAAIGRGGSPCGQAVNFGSSLKAILTLPDEPRTRKFWMDVTNSSGKYLRLDESQEGTLGIGRRQDDPGIQLIAVLQRHAHRARILDDDLLHAGIHPQLRAQAPAPQLAIAPLTPPEPPLAKPQARNAPSISPM